MAADCSRTRPIRVHVLCAASPEARTARALIRDCGQLCGSCAYMARLLRALQVLMEIRGNAYGKLKSFQPGECPHVAAGLQDEFCVARTPLTHFFLQNDSCEHI